MSFNSSALLPAVSPVSAVFNSATGGGPAHAGDPMVYRCKYGEINKLTHYNYARWKRDIEFFLQAESALSIVLGDEVHPGGRVARGTEFDRRSGKAAAIINASCHGSVKTYINGMRDPHLMWEELRTKLDTSNTRAGRTAILRHFNQLRPTPGSSIAEYVTLLLDCRQELEGSEQAIQNETFITHLVTSLPAECNSIVDIITHQPIERQTVDYVIATLVEWETSRRNHKLEVGSNATVGSTMITGNALHVRSQQVRVRNSGRFRPKSSPRANFVSSRPSSTISLTCWYCNKKGHRQANCFAKRRADRARLERSGLQKRGPPQHEELNESAFASVKALMARTSATTRTVGNPGTWLVDSGASHHMCSNARYFSNIHRLAKPIKVSLGDGSVVFASAAGTVSLRLPTTTISFPSLYIPHLTYSLLSVSRLSKCPEYSVLFHDNRCYLKVGSPKNVNFQDGNTHVLGSLRNGLYELSHAGQDVSCMVSGSGESLTSLGASLGPSATFQVSPKVFLQLWHERLAHLNLDSLKELVPPAAYGSGHEALLSQPCTICIKAKHQRHITRIPVERTTRPFELIHSDLCGPIQPESASGFRYFIVYIDDFSRSVWVYFLRSKTAVEVVSVFQELLASLEKKYPQWPMVRFRCDNGRGEYDNSLFRGILRVSGISFEPSPPYTQHKNGVSERMIRTLVTKAPAMLLDSKLPDQFWAEAINTASYLHDRSPSRTTGGHTPYEKLRKKKPEISHLRRFGCPAYKLIPEEQRSGKFSERAQECIFLGYVHDTWKIWRLWEPQGKRVIQASDVRFDESKVLGTTVREHMNLENSILGSIVSRDLPAEEDDLELLVPASTDSLQTGAPISISTSVDDTASTPGAAIPEQPDFTSTEVAPCTTTSTGQANSPSLRHSMRLRSRSKYGAMFVETNKDRNWTTEGDPLSYREALGQSCSEQWKKAIQDEFASLLENHTWDYVDTIPAESKSIGCRWVFRKKVNPDRSIRFKARLVIKEYEQVPGVDFGDTFAPVGKLASLRLILGHAIRYGWETHHMDVVTAFLHPAIHNPVFMNLPEGIEFLGELPPNTCACYLRKALYGLKQAPRLWYHHINTFLQSIGFKQSANDPNLYLRYKLLAETSIRVPEVVILLYVDDLLISARNIQTIKEVKKLLHTKYRMNDLGQVQQFLGLEVTQTLPNKIQIHQAQFISTVLKRFGMTDCNGVYTPMESGQRLCLSVETDELTDQGEYQSLIGSLMYLVVGTRPDISFTVATLSKFSSKPNRIHLTAAKRLLRYLQQTKTLALTYYKDLSHIHGSCGELENRSILSTSLIGYSNSDFAGDHDDRKSTSGYIFSYAGGAVSWRAKKQKLVSISTVEAEYISYSESACEGIWLKRLYDEIKGEVTNPKPLTIFCDNQGAIEITRNPKFHERTKHIDIKYHFVRSLVEDGKLNLSYIPSSEQVANITTKALSRDSHWKHVQGLGMEYV